MIIGVPKEVKNNENRVALDPTGVGVLVNAGHEVIVETDAGAGSNFINEAYEEHGANVLDYAGDVWEKAEMIMKVKEPQPSEYDYFREGLILFTYLHLANEPELTKALVDNKVTAVAYETIEEGSHLPLLDPMSEVAGRMSTQIGIHYLEKINGGKGIVIGGVPGTPRGTVSIIGGGTVGANAAKIAIGLGANVNILELNAERRRELETEFGDRVQTLASNSGTIAKAVRESDILIGSVLVAGKKAPKLVTTEMVETMDPGTVIVDPAIDQGGNIEGFDEATTHDEPIIKRHGILYYGVANMPGSVPNTASIALAGNTVNYAVQIANAGDILKAVEGKAGFVKGINTYDGQVTYQPVAEDLGYDYKELFK